MSILIWGNYESICLIINLSSLWWQTWRPCVPDSIVTKWMREMPKLHINWTLLLLALIFLSFSLLEYSPAHVYQYTNILKIGQRYSITISLKIKIFNIWISNILADTDLFLDLFSHINVTEIFLYYHLQILPRLWVQPLSICFLWATVVHLHRSKANQPLKAIYNAYQGIFIQN